MKRALTICMAMLCLAPAAFGLNKQDRFKDVPTDSWAYRAVTGLQKARILLGYPAELFNGKRALTRYDFAMALKRALDLYPPAVPDVKTAALLAPAEPATGLNPSLDQILIFKKLVLEFEGDLKALGVNTAEATKRLELAAKAAPVSSRVSQLPDSDPASNPGGLLFSMPQAGSITSPASTLTELLNRQIPGAAGMAREFRPSIPIDLILPYNHVDALSHSDSELQAPRPVSQIGKLGLSVGGTSADPLAIIGTSSNGAFMVGADLLLKPIGRLGLNAGASTSISQAGTRGYGQPFDDNGAFHLGLSYKSGPLTLSSGYQYIDPGYWNGSGLDYSLANVQGPFVRSEYRLFPSTSLTLGGDLLSGAHGGPISIADAWNGGISTEDDINRIVAGLKWQPRKGTFLDLSWQTLYWSLDSASAANGASRAFESYINLGAAIQLSSLNTLRLGYQIGANSNWSGFGGAGAGGINNGFNVFSAELSVHF